MSDLWPVVFIIVVSIVYSTSHILWYLTGLKEQLRDIKATLTSIEDKIANLPHL